MTYSTSYNILLNKKEEARGKALELRREMESQRWPLELIWACCEQVDIWLEHQLDKLDAQYEERGE
jgi:hypothetical protein